MNSRLRTLNIRKGLTRIYLLYVPVVAASYFILPTPARSPVAEEWHYWMPHAFGQYFTQELQPQFDQIEDRIWPAGSPGNRTNGRTIVTGNFFDGKHIPPPRSEEDLATFDVAKGFLVRQFAREYGRGYAFFVPYFLKEHCVSICLWIFLPLVMALALRWPLFPLFLWIKSGFQDPKSG